MTPQEMQAKSSEKVQQVLSLLKVLNLTLEGHQRVNKQGIIENVVSWIDNEKYPAAPEPEPEVVDAVVEPPAPAETPA